MARRIVAFGVPSAAGAFTDAPARTPTALRAAGLLPALEAKGLEVADVGDLPFRPATEDEDHPHCRNVVGVLGALQATADTAAAHEGFCLMLGGDCSLFPGLLAGVRRRLGDDVGVVYLDAHGDLNTPHTTPSGRICGMALAVALGHGHEQLVASFGRPALDPGRTVLLGFRDLDPGERRVIGDFGLALEAASLIRSGVERAADLALRVVGSGPFVVHLDVDVMDASEMSTQMPAVRGQGLSRTNATALLRRLLDSGQAAALGVTGFDAERDVDGAHARALVEILSAALAPA